MMKILDLRSDTVTKPTEEMREAMYKAPVGDDVYGDDPTVKELENNAAEILGKEAALFVPSGTFGNQLALLTHCKRGDEVILGDDCHIVSYEGGAAAIISGVNLRTITSCKGELNPRDIQNKIRAHKDIHFPSTGLIALENAHSNGRVIPLDTMAETYNLAQKHNIPVHLDGARIFNAAASLDVKAKEIAQYADSIMFCLSKGLCAPVGSILAGKEDFIERARKGRKLMGGGLRQVGVLAAAGLVALEKMVPLLKVDHENALLLGRELSLIKGIKVSLEDIHINMVFIDLKEVSYDASKLAPALLERGIKVNPATNGIMRFVTHHWITEEDVNYIVNSIKDCLGE